MTRRDFWTKDLFGDPAKGYPDTPGWKEPSTSRDAAEIMEATAETIRGEALRTLKQSRKCRPIGLTADQVATAIDRSILAVRPRITELKIMGLIDRTGERRLNKSGILAAVWVALTD
jgi:DNA-binding transcriptional ArsR family regulator